MFKVRVYTNTDPAPALVADTCLLMEAIPKGVKVAVVV
jgi:hypothetical protein